VDVQHRLAYAVGFLKGKAYEQILPLIDEGNINIVSVEALITLLENAFGDPDRVRTAERNLQSLRQKNRNFSDYLADIERYAGEVSWNDAAKQTSLYEGLSAELKDALVTLDTSDELDQYIILLKRVDNKILSCAPECKGSSSTWRSPTTTPITTPKPAAPPTNTTTATGTQVSPMDLSAGRRRLSQAQRQDRMRRGQCFYCGEQTTWLDNVQTDKVTSEPMLLLFVHLRQWFLTILVPSPNTWKTNRPMYSPRHCHGTRIAFFVTFFIRFIS